MSELPVVTGQNNEEEWPCSVVWAPIPLVSQLFPIIGHTMLTDSKGQLYDFAGFVPGAQRCGVCRNVGIFGRAVKVWRINAQKVSEEEFQDDWDEAVAAANQRFERQVHMGCVNNCHSHVCFALNRLRHSSLPRWLHWNSVVLALAMLLVARFIPSRGGCFRVWYLMWPLCALWIALRWLGMWAA
ncbi:unnamed protein product [Effrenium voratum]|nr:unnamed protein product [Effrenium voratum]